MKREGRKTALVTGAASGIGRTIALRFADAGIQVVVADIDVDGGRKAAADIESSGGSAIFHPANIGIEADVEKLVAAAVEHFGKLDICINNAGIPPAALPLHQLSLDNWNSNLAVNLTGTFLCVKHAVMQMLNQGGGVIVNISSVAAVRSVVGSHVYSCAKRAILALTSCAAIEYAKNNIRVNAVLPGYIQGPLADRVEASNPAMAAQFRAGIPMGHFGEGSDIAEAALWLCSDSSRYVTGQTLTVDGGMTA